MTDDKRRAEASAIGADETFSATFAEASRAGLFIGAVGAAAPGRFILGDMAKIVALPNRIRRHNFEAHPCTLRDV